MANWLQRLEVRWMRRYASPPVALPDDAGRQPVTLITGGSEGIGRALATEFAARGHRLMLIARSETYLQTAAAELGRDYGVAVHTAVIDLSAHDAVARVEAALEAAGLYPDYLVNNAGFGLNGHFTDHEAVRISQLIELNIGTLTGLIRRYLPDMLARARGGILNIASVGGLFPGPYTAAYYASKAYVVSLTEALAYENAGRGVRISAALPGPVATRFHEKMGASNGIYLQLQTVPRAETVARVTYSGFMGRRTLITPGIMTTFNAIAVRFIPHFLLVPFIGWFLKQRY
jgi:short-subunit dehydrogenase